MTYPKITLQAARVNVFMNQEEAAKTERTPSNVSR
jgi:hypothetical protein